MSGIKDKVVAITGANGPLGSISEEQFDRTYAKGGHQGCGLARVAARRSSRICKDRRDGPVSDLQKISAAGRGANMQVSRKTVEDG
jgi:hypothetical protein